MDYILIIYFFRNRDISQEVKILLEAIIIANSVISCELLVNFKSLTMLFLEFTRLVADVMVFGNLMGILTWSWYLNRA